MEYEIIGWQDANELKNGMNAKFIYTIESNQSSLAKVARIS